MAGAPHPSLEVANHDDSVLPHWSNDEPCTLHLLSQFARGCRWKSRYPGREDQASLSEPWFATVAKYFVRFGTAFSFLAQISLGAAIWASYTRWLWRTVQRKEMTVGGLNAAFAADTSVLSLLNLEMLRKLRIGSVMAAFAWYRSPIIGNSAVQRKLMMDRGLLLPPFFTPATLFVYQSSDVEISNRPMPFPHIANATPSVGSTYSYSPPARRGRIQFVNDVSRIFVGPRTIVSLIASATASLGEILPIKLPYNTSAHDIDFHAPIVQCLDANTTVVELIESFRKQDMAEGDGVVVETDSVYFSFVPSYNETGDLYPALTPRLQTRSSATNELWMTFLRPSIESGKWINDRRFQVCTLHNATYHLHIERDHGIQNITKSYTINEQIH